MTLLEQNAKNKTVVIEVAYQDSEAREAYMTLKEFKKNFIV